MDACPARMLSSWLMMTLTPVCLYACVILLSDVRGWHLRLTWSGLECLGAIVLPATGACSACMWRLPSCHACKVYSRRVWLTDMHVSPPAHQVPKTCCASTT
jgi:hypothetical protein